MSAAMKPILFCTMMVQATLQELKTNTRRICNIPDGWEYNGWGRITSKHPKQGKLGIFIRKQDGDFVLSDIITAKYQVGDVLWVRETFVIGVPDGSMPESDTNPITVFYKADNSVHGWMDENEDECNIPWKPSIFMPKEYARIFLRVTNVRVERLQDISYGDILKEGFNPSDLINPVQDAQNWWITLWNSINGKGAWEANPYVFVYTFQRVEKPKEMK